MERGDGDCVGNCMSCCWPGVGVCATVERILPADPVHPAPATPSDGTGSAAWNPGARASTCDAHALEPLLAGIRAEFGADVLATGWRIGLGREMPPKANGRMRHAASHQSAPYSLFAGHPSSLPDGLTAREVEVLLLLARRYSNKEIATELVLSVRTVERHLSNIYAKTGIPDRRHALTYAQGHGLIPPD